MREGMNWPSTSSATPNSSPTANTSAAIVPVLVTVQRLPRRIIRAHVLVGIMRHGLGLSRLPPLRCGTAALASLVGNVRRPAEFRLRGPLRALASSAAGSSVNGYARHQDQTARGRCDQSRGAASACRLSAREAIASGTRAAAVMFRFCSTHAIGPECARSAKVRPAGTAFLTRARKPGERSAG